MSVEGAIRPLVAPNALHLILMPTEKCNFRCTYCYEDFLHGRMARETIEGILNLLRFRGPDLQFLHLEWFGGEPLLELPIVEEVQAEVQALARRHPGLKPRSTMTTNGYRLTAAVLERLVGLGVRQYQISLDGLAAEHDRRRKLGGGGGTFHRIWSNLQAAHRSPLDFRISIRTHVDRENHQRIEGFLEAAAAAFGGDERFRIFLRPVARLGGSGDAAIPVLGEEGKGIVEGLRQRAAELGLKTYAPGGGPCYAAAANSFVIRSTGEIAKCSVAFRHPNNRVGQLRADGTASLDQRRFNGWVRGLFSGDAGELACPMKGFADARSSPPPSTALSARESPLRVLA